MNLKDSTLSSLFWKLFERGGRALIELIVQIVMARILAPDEFGALSIMLVFVNMGNVIVQSGLNTAIVQTPQADDRDYSTVFWLSFGVSGVLYVAVFAAAPLVARFYSMPHIIYPLRVLALILFINALNSVQIAIIQRNLEFQKFFNATIASVIVSAATGIGLAISGFGLWALVFQQLSYQITNCVAHAAQLSWRPHFVFVGFRAKELFSYGWKLLVSGLLDQAYQSLSDLIIGKQFSAVELGLVSQGKKYPQAVGSLLDGAIQPVMLSVVAHVQNDKARVKALVRRALKTSTYLIFPAMTLFAVVAEPVVIVLLGEKWLPCVPFLRIYCFVYALLPVHSTNLQALNGVGRSDLFLKLELIKKCYGTVCLLFAAFVLKEVHLMVATYIITGIISTFVNAAPNKRVIGYAYREQLRDICPALLLSLLTGALCLTLSTWGFPPLTQMLVQIFVFGAVYIALSKAFHLEAFNYLIKTIEDYIKPLRA